MLHLYLSCNTFLYLLNINDLLVHRNFFNYIGTYPVVTTSIDPQRNSVQSRSADVGILILFRLMAVLVKASFKKASWFHTRKYGRL